MNLLLNLIWLVLGGFIVVIGYLLGAILLCITIVGIPFGIRCFKLAGLALARSRPWAAPAGVRLPRRGRSEDRVRERP